MLGMAQVTGPPGGLSQPPAVVAYFQVLETDTHKCHTLRDKSSDTLPATPSLPSWTLAMPLGRKWNFFSTHPLLRRAARTTG